jgi:DNA-3-methyladenine glycosylase
LAILWQDFYARPTLTVARALLGQRLVRDIDGQRLSGWIVETEAYIGPEDTANHASKGRTARTEVMFGPPGYIYVYFVYGMHYMLNFTTEGVGFPAAVLIRAIEPLAGQALMQFHRQKADSPPLKPANLTNGPGKLCQALRIDKSLNRLAVTTGQALWVEADQNIPDAAVATGPRIGVGYAQPKDRAASWRFWVRDSRFVSK